MKIIVKCGRPINQDAYSFTFIKYADDGRSFSAVIEDGEFAWHEYRACDILPATFWFAGRELVGNMSISEDRLRELVNELSVESVVDVEIG